MTYRIDRVWPRTARGWLCAGSAAVLLSACGGGGGSDRPVVSALDFPVETAVSVYMQSPHQFNLAGSLNGSNVTMSYTFTPGALAAFEGHVAHTATEVAVLTANGVQSQVRFTNYFALDPYVSYGSLDLDTGEYAVFNQTANLPATARVGQSGALGNEISYVDSSEAQVTDTSTLGWSLEADTATTALFCINVNVNNSSVGDGSQCYRIDANGTVLDFVMRVNVNGSTLTLK
ncbi:MAG: hypothetical protein B7Y51_01395 [Burkholderiales bacterium 28-67-8]|nr:MAG: hypothetical protein B7Y51_01395 [Burkholderiales bacterium 28-67-8]